MQLIEGRKIYLFEFVDCSNSVAGKTNWKLKPGDTFSGSCTVEGQGCWTWVARSSPSYRQLCALSAVEVQAAAAVFVLFSHTATLSLPCKGISLPVVQFQLPLCPAHTIYLFLCVHWGFFLKRKRYVQRKKDAQKQTKTSCSPVVSKTFCGKRNLLWI